MQKELTKVFVDQVKPTNKRQLIFDKKQKGLALVIEKSGTKTFAFIYHSEGRTHWLKVARVGELSLKAARETVEKLQAQRVLGTDPAEERRAEKREAQKPTAPTFDAVASEYFEKCQLKSVPKYREHYERHIRAALGTRPVTELETRDFVLSIRNPLADAGKVATANAVIATASAILSWAVDRGVIASNPAHGVKAAKKPDNGQEAHVALSGPQLRALWSALPLVDDQMAAGLALMLYTAQRGDEVRRMRWEDVQGPWWTQQPREGQAANKAKRAHRVYLSPAARAVLDALGPKDSGPVLPDYAKAKTWRDLAPIRHEAGVAEFTAHSLRKTAITRMAMLKVPKADRMAVANHSASDVHDGYNATAIYDADDEKRDAMLRLEHHLNRVLDGDTFDEPSDFEKNWRPNIEELDRSTTNVVAFS